MFDIFLHKWLRIPYALNVRTHRKVANPRATLVFIHGLGTTGAAWNSVIKALPKDITIISIDLLGFGKSPRPAWATYNAKTQARSVIATLLKLRLTASVVLVGHSMGSLVAVEIAKRYPLLVRSLILCSPPFYKMETEAKSLFPNGDKILLDLFKYSKDHPESFVKIAELALRYGLVNAEFAVTSETVGVYMAALEASIINQTSLADAKRLKVPMKLIMGQLDPVVIKRNLKELVQDGKNRELTTVLAAGHEVRGRLVPAVVQAINDTLEK
jgi:pimeloyl-ACP methyl ester carboxylesterase